MKLRARVDRLAGRIRRPEDAPSAVLYIPDNGRGDAPPGRYGAIVIYDPANPPPEIREAEGWGGTPAKTGPATASAAPSGTPRSSSER